MPATAGTDHPEDDRHLAFGCTGLILISDGTWLARFDVGDQPTPRYQRGVYDLERHENVAFRWFGGPEGLTWIRFPQTDLGVTTEVMLTGFLPEIDEQPVTVYTDGTLTDDRVLTTETGQYRFSTTA